ncbi:serine/threonine-protein kinase pim-2-like [Centroberyx affinis]|uniref:serine/threonine-protein kinase pim-2-like n=1 Tax=Centroberyx affinis TaxID=166261 RepID=UPI003A5B94F3
MPPPHHGPESVLQTKSLCALTSRRDPGRAVRHSEPSKLPVQEAGAERKRRSKRKASRKCSQEEEGAKKKSGEAQHNQHCIGTHLTRDLVNLLQTKTSKTCSKAEFRAKYEELGHLGEGGFGAVYRGYRKEDFLPVSGYKTHCSGPSDPSFPLEVLLLYKVGGEPGSPGQNAAVTLLDHYELDQELILVMERPAPCMDLFDYVKESGGSLQEHEAKILLRQLVEAMLEIHGKGVTHGDIKFENLLVETGSRTPRLRLIDFGTVDYTPPEWYACRCHSAATTTVWQLGVLLYGALTGYFPFSSTMGILFKRPVIMGELSQHPNPKSRPTLESLLQHPWLC